MPVPRILTIKTLLRSNKNANGAAVRFVMAALAGCGPRQQSASLLAPRPASELEGPAVGAGDGRSVTAFSPDWVIGPSEEVKSQS